MSEEQGNSPVMVDMAELGRGLETVFSGVAMVFGSLGKTDAEVATALSGVAMPTVAAVKIGETSVDSTTAVLDDTADEKPPETPTEQPEPKQPEPEQPMQQETESEPPSDASGSTGAPTTVTQDDITKVIVAKIKQKRSNNVKIGALLKTYGVDKVSSLPTDKYEAFLTDISQL